MVVDTSIFIEYLRAKDKKKSLLFSIPDSTQLYISSVTMYELLMGATDENKQKVLNYLPRIYLYYLSMKAYPEKPLKFITNYV